MLLFFDVPYSAADVTAPTLTSPTGVQTGQTTADGTVSSDEGNGVLYAVVTQSNTAPSAAQVQAGQDHLGATADASNSKSVTAIGIQSLSFTGLSANTTYYIHYQQQDAAANDSAVVSSASFTTDAVPVATEDDTTGGGWSWWFKYEQEQLKRQDEERQRIEKAKAIQNKLDRELAQALLKEEAEKERKQELFRLTNLARKNRQQQVIQAYERVNKAADRAIKQGNYSAMEALERELRRAREEVEFFEQAVSLILSQE